MRFHCLVSTILTFILAVYFMPVCAQCPLNVDAGPDQVACAPTGTATLQGSVAGMALGYNWDPIIGLSNPNSLTPTVTVTGTQTYTLTASAFDPLAPNLVVNPAFEGGNTGFTSQLIQNPLPITPGTYVLTTSPSLVISNFPPCDDHTFGNGTGFMMLVNGTGNSNTQIWCQNIPVTPNTWYSMSAWATASPISPPQLQFSVNGQLLGSPFPVQTNPCNWQEFSAAWYSGTASTVELCIMDQNGSGNGFLGDDFALDDVYFGEACTISDEVMVSLVEVEAVLPPNVILECNDLPQGLVLDGSGSSAGPNISYLWTTNDGNILSGATTLMPLVNLEGTYTLSVTYNDGTVVCSDQASIQVLPDPNMVMAIIGPPDELNCNNPTISLNGGGASSGPTISYQWTPIAGIVTGGDTPFPVVNMGGNYTLLVTNSISGCTATETIFVFENFTEPVAMASAPEELTCVDTIVSLSGNGSSTGNEYSYQWITTDGSIVAGANTLNNCEVDSAGVYTLTVTNTQNGCTSNAFVVLMANTDAPTAVASAPQPIGCGGGEVELSGSGSSTGSGFDYLWTTANGNIFSGATTLSPTVDASAEYLLTVTDSDNGCTGSDTTFLSENTANIYVDISIPDTLDCVLLSQNLDATGSSQGADLSFDWTTLNGNLTAGQTTLAPTVDAPGTYTLTITDDPTGCTAQASVTVFEDVDFPMVEAGPAMSIDCDAAPVELDGTGSDTGPNFSLEWTTLGGNFTSGENTLSPEVNAVGEYFLTITNLVNGCTAVDSTDVTQIGDAPVVELILTDTLDCLTEILMIDGSGSSSAPQILIEWTTSGGSFAGGENTLTPDVDGAGVYTLTLTDQSTGCVSSGSVTVEIDTVPPVVALAIPPVLNCDSVSVHLDATGSTATGLFAVSWNFLNGSGGIIGGGNTLTPEVNEPGEYVLTVVQWGNGCSASDTIEVLQDVAPPAVEAGTGQTLTCDVTSVELDGTGSGSGPFIEYQWGSSSGLISNGGTTLMPTVDGPGIYVLTVSNTENGCTAQDSVAVDQSADLPLVNILPADTLTCDMVSIVLDGSGSSTGAEFAYLWTTVDGNLTFGETTLTPTAEAPGTYVLTVTNTSNNCAASELVIVQQNGDLPTAEAGQPFAISCALPEGNLDGSGSSSGADFSYLWTTMDGNILSGETSLFPTVNASGMYLLTVTNDLNGCTSTDEVLIDQDADLPIAMVASADVLTCLEEEVTLDGTGSSQGVEFTYSWTTLDGNILSGQNTLNPVVDASGSYLLTVTNTSSQCEGLASVTVFEISDGPEVTIVDPGFINCEDTTTLINTSIVGQPDIIWSTTTGEILSGEDTESPTVGAMGIYLLTATDVVSGCVSQALVEVLGDTLSPTLILDYPMQLSCGQTEAILDASGSDLNGDFYWNWTFGMGGEILDNLDSGLLVSVPGYYTLEVFNEVNGCSTFQAVNLESTGDAPSASIALPDELNCITSEIILDASSSSSAPDITIVWETLDGNFAGGQTTLTPLVDAPGTYQLILENALNGCADTTSVVVVQNIEPPGAEAGEDNILTCDEPEIALAGSSPTLNVDFAWTTSTGNILFGANSQMPGVNAEGVYFLTITNPENGCTSLDSLELFSTHLDEFFYVSSDADCASGEGSVIFQWVQGGIGWYEYSIDGGATFSDQMDYEGLPPGTYLLAVQDSGGCLITEEVTISVATDLFVSLPQNVNLNLGDDFQLTPMLDVPPEDIAEIIWSPAEGLSCVDCLNPIASIAEDIEYHLTLTDINGCTGTATVNFVLAGAENGVYVPNAFSPNGDGFNDGLVLFADENLVQQVDRFLVFTRWGESVFENYRFAPNEINFGWDGSHRGEELGAGVYVWFAEVTFINGEKKFFEGEVNLMK